MAILEELERDPRRIDNAGSAVVGIGRRTRGSGVVIADGRVLTNAQPPRRRGDGHLP
jgi:hypothetical protein